MTRSRFFTALDVAMMELHLIVRSRTTRYLMVVFPVFAAAAAIPILLMPGHVQYHDYIFLVGAYNPLTYLLLAVSWNATHADGLFGLPIAAAAHLEGRLLAAALLAVPLVAVLTIEVVVLRPEMILLPVVSMAFAVMVTGLPIIAVSVRYPRNVNADASPLEDLGKFGMAQYVCGFGVILPVWLVGRFVSTAELVAMLVGATVIAMAVYPFVLRWAAAKLALQVPMLCETFRRT